MKTYELITVFVFGRLGIS